MQTQQQKNANVFDRPRDHQTKRDAVLRAAANMFNKRGYAATSLDEIAAQFNITKTSLYYYVGSKPILLQRCYEDTLDYCEYAMDTATKQDSSGLDKIVTYLRMIIAEAQENCIVAVVNEFDCLPEDARPTIHRRAKKLDEGLLALIEEGIADGSVAPIPTKIAELLLMGAINWIWRWYEQGGKNTPEEIADCFMSLFINGLKGDANARP